jgi:hypothetical protein
MDICDRTVTALNAGDLVNVRMTDKGYTLFSFANSDPCKLREFREEWAHQGTDRTRISFAHEPALVTAVRKNKLLQPLGYTLLIHGQSYDCSFLLARKYLKRID